jgi:hypothetical protein
MGVKYEDFGLFSSPICDQYGKRPEAVPAFPLL